MSTVYTYFADIGGGPDNDALLELWRETWSQCGWNPVVLGPEHVLQHPLHPAMSAAIREYPTVNGAEYEAACYLRWLALDVVGGGLFTDHDTMNLGYTPGLHAAIFGFMEHGPFPQPPTPVHAEAVDASMMANAIIDWNPHDFMLVDGRPHLSDMYILRSVFWNTPVNDACRTFRRGDDWKTKPLVHFNANWLQPGESRAQLVRDEIERRGLWT